jgi:hypothetical protein
VTDLLALVCGVKAAVMLDYVSLQRHGSAVRCLAALRKLLAAVSTSVSSEALQLAVLRLGDCFWLIQPGLLRARAAEAPTFIEVGGPSRVLAGDQASALARLGGASTHLS